MIIELMATIKKKHSPLHLVRVRRPKNKAHTRTYKSGTGRRHKQDVLIPMLIVWPC